MSRTLVSLTVVALACAGGIIAWLSSTRAAPDDPPPAAAPAESPRRDVPLTQVVLFNTGVGYFVRQGQVDGNARIELVVPVEDVNDILKSLVVDDGGKPGAVGFDGTEAIDHALRSFSLDLTGNPTLGQLLNQARGHRVEVTLDGAAAGFPAGPLAGSIVGMEASTGPEKEAHGLNLLTADGVRRLPLERVTRVRFLDPRLENEFKQALAVLASGRGDKKRRVWAEMRGEGKRDVRMSYVLETSVWKATYRLALDGKATLETRAIVENTTGEDWKDVALTLAAGRPITFEMELARPLFVPRPPVQPEFYASLQPPAAGLGAVGTNFGGQLGGVNLGALGAIGAQLGGVQLGGIPPMPGTVLGALGGGAFTGLGMIGNPFLANRYQWPATDFTPPRRQSYEEMVNQRRQALEEREQRRAEADANGRTLADAVESLAVDATKIGEGFRRKIESKVSIPRQTSALLPVHRGPIEAVRVSLYNPATHPNFPLHAVRLKNTTGQALLQGPVSVTDAGTYAGDCRLPDMAPGEQRLVSFAMDLGVEVRRQAGETVDQRPDIRVVKGRLETTPLTHRTSFYSLTNRSKAPRTVLVEHRIEEGWTPRGKPAESTPTHHRYEAKVAGGEALREQVDEQMRGSVKAVPVRDLADAALRKLADDPPSDGLKTFAEKALDLRGKAEAARRESAKARDQVTALRNEQDRLRERIGKLPEGSPALKRLREEFDVQEKHLEKVGKQALGAGDAESRAVRELETFSATADAR